MTQSGPTLGQTRETVESRTARQVLVVGAMVFVLWLCVQLKVILVDVIIAITLASAIAPIASKFEGKRVPRAVTVLLTYLVVGCFYATMAYMLWNPISEQGTLLAQHLPGLIENANRMYDQTMQRIGLNVPINVGPDEFKNIGTSVLNRTLIAGAGVLGILLNAVLVLFLAAYFVANSKRIWAALLKWVPLKQRARAESLIGPVGGRMGGYVRGQILVSTAVAAFFAIGLSLIGVKYALVLGLMAGVMNLVPFVGSMITTVLAVIVASNQSLLTAVLTIGLFGLEQAVESNFIVPYLLGSQVELDPLVVLLAILVGGTLGGAIGALIAVPIASALILLAQELYLKPMHEQESVL